MRALFVLAAFLSLPMLLGDGDNPQETLRQILLQRLGEKRGDLYELVGLFLSRHMSGDVRGRLHLLRMLRDAAASWLKKNSPDTPLPQITPSPQPETVTRQYNISNLLFQELLPPEEVGLSNFLAAPGTKPFASLTPKQLLKLFRLIAGTDKVFLNEKSATLTVTTTKTLHSRIESLLKALRGIGTPVCVDFEIWSTSSAVLTNLLKDGVVIGDNKRGYLEGCRRRGDALLVASGSVLTRDWVAGCEKIGREHTYTVGGRSKRIWYGVVVWARPVSLGGAKWILQTAVARIKPHSLTSFPLPYGKCDLPCVDTAFITTASVLWESQWTLVGATTARADQPGTSSILLARIRPVNWRTRR